MFNFFEKKDNCKIIYVLSTEHPNGKPDHVYDIFYRETPHPKFENYYFGKNNF